MRRPSVLVGGCMELGDDGLPFAPFVEAFRSLVRERDGDDLDRLLGPGRAELGTSGARPRRRGDRGSQPRTRPSPRPGSSSTSLGCWAGSATTSRCCSMLEDLHWADRSTRDLIRFLVRSLRRERVFLLLTYRSDDLHRRHPLMPLLSELGAPSRRDRSRSTGSIATRRRPSSPGSLDAVPDPTARRRPVRPLGRQSVLRRGTRRLRELSRPEAIPTTIREIVGVRVARLSESSQASLRIGALVGRRIDHDLLARPGGHRRSAELVERIKPAVDERIVLADRRRRTDRLRVPPRPRPGGALRRAPAGRADDACTPDWHEILETRRIDERRSSTQPGRDRAPLVPRARPGARALSASVRAAEEAADLPAYAEVSAQLERVLELWPGVDDAEALAGMDRAEALRRAADAAAAIGEYTRAIALGREVLVGARRRTAPPIVGWRRAIGSPGTSGTMATPAGRSRRSAARGRSAHVRRSVARVRLLTDVAQLHWSAARFARTGRGGRRGARAVVDGRQRDRAGSRPDDARGRAGVPRRLRIGRDPARARARGARRWPRGSSGLRGHRDGARAQHRGPLRAGGRVRLSRAGSPAGRRTLPTLQRLPPHGPRGCARRGRAMARGVGTPRRSGLAARRKPGIGLDVREHRPSSRASRATSIEPSAAIAEARASSFAGRRSRSTTSGCHRAEGLVAEAAGRMAGRQRRLLGGDRTRHPVPTQDWPLAFWVIQARRVDTEADLAEAARAGRDRGRGARGARARPSAPRDRRAGGRGTPRIPRSRAFGSSSRSVVRNARGWRGDRTRTRGPPRSRPSTRPASGPMRRSRAVREGEALLARGSDRERAARDAPRGARRGAPGRGTSVARADRSARQTRPDRASRPRSQPRLRHPAPRPTRTG